MDREIETAYTHNLALLVSIHYLTLGVLRNNHYNYNIFAQRKYARENPH